jgi:ubiquinone/menaquinone biosynthesis C-methylase UbiE/uncharacterized protein YbaR (Trm112 family)
MNTKNWKEWLVENLVCPRDNDRLELVDNNLICPLGHIYPLIDDIPVMLVDDVTPTQNKEFCNSLEMAKSYVKNNQVESSHQLGVIVQSKYQIIHEIDPFVQDIIGATGGNLYTSLIGKLTRYPIPELLLPQGNNQLLLDIGCNWGRWCISATQLGYQAIGIDHNIEALRAAKRVSTQLGVQTNYIVADGRYLPFKENTFDVVFSYSVLQHFSKDNVRLCLAGVSKILKTQGYSFIQLPNRFGIVNSLYQLKRGFCKAVDFEVRYWTINELSDTFSRLIGETSISVDGFFSLNPQVTDIDILPWYYRWIVNTSNTLKSKSEKSYWLKYLADSLYVKSIKGG